MLTMAAMREYSISFCVIASCESDVVEEEGDARREKLITGLAR